MTHEKLNFIVSPVFTDLNNEQSCRQWSSGRSNNLEIGFSRQGKEKQPEDQKMEGIKGTTCSNLEIQERIALIRKDPSALMYPPPQTPAPPSINPTMSVPRRMQAIQRYLSSFQYNFTGQTFVPLRRDKGMKHLVFSAKALMRECLPIQCVEALFIGVFLTNGIEDLLRIPVSFKSISDGVEYCHIILGVKHKNLWGSLGISRLPNLMYKPLKYNSLPDLIMDYNKCYSGYFHKLVNVSIGLPFSHNRISETALQWSFVKYSLENDPGNCWSHRERCNRYSKDCSFIATYFEGTGVFPPWCDKAYRSGEGHAKSR